MGQSTRGFTNCLACGKPRFNRPMNLFCSRACYRSGVPKPLCAVEDCERKVRGRQLYCAMHYERWRLKGDPGQAGKLPLGVSAQGASSILTVIERSKWMVAGDLSTTS